MKKKKKNITFYIILLISMPVIYYYFIHSDYSIIKMLELSKKNEELKKEVRVLKEKIEEQKRSNELLKNKDPYEMEKRARESGMIKEGEKIYKYEIIKEK